MENLNSFELSVLERLSNEYPTIKYHLPFLRVLSRETTGVGVFVYFCYAETSDDIPDLDIDERGISINEAIEIPGLIHGLIYVVFITDGKLDFLELVTLDEPWDGNTDDIMPVWSP